MIRMKDNFNRTQVVYNKGAARDGPLSQLDK